MTARPADADGPGAAGALLLIGDAARHVGVSPSALRLWERQGLVCPARTSGGERRYGPAELARLRTIARLRRVDGLNAAAIRRLLGEDEPTVVKGTATGAASPADGSAFGGTVRDAGGAGGGALRDGRRPAGGRPATHGAQASQPPSPGLPSRLRALRASAGLTLREAAERAGLSVSFVSAVERGLTGVSMASLKRLVSVYGATLGELLQDGAADRRRLVRADARRVMEAARGVRIEDLASSPSALEPQLFVLAPGTRSNGAYAHAGEEFMYLLAGSLGVWLDETEYYQLGPGDALTFPSSLTHRFQALGSAETRLIWVNTPPTF